MATQNIAAWLTGPKVKPFKVDSAPMPIAGPSDVIIKNHAVATNLADWVIQHTGIILREDQYPAVLGFDLAGEIVSVGSEVKDFALGDRVCGIAFKDFSQKNSAFQLYTQSTTELLAKIPDHITFKDSCVLPLAMCTATAALFEADGLALPYPKVEPVKTGKIVLIWSGSSSVGTCAIQAAIAAGFEVATTASSHNLEYCKSLGAKWAFDYRKDGVDDEIVETLKGYECVGVLDAWSRGTLARCANLILRLQGRKRLQTVFHKDLPLGEEIPNGVEVGYTYGTNIAKSDVGPAVWRHWIPKALAVGALQCKPTAKVVGKGLESIQIACNMGVAGEVSASKLVVELV